MEKDNYPAVIDFGSSELRLGVFDNKFSKLFYQSKLISQKNNYEEYSKSINLLIREAENKISNHLQNITVLYDTPDIYSIDLSIKKKLDQKVFPKEICSLILLDANQLIKNFYTNRKIIHLIVNKYIINGKEFLNIPDELYDLKSVIMEIKFLCIPYDQYLNIVENFKKNNLKILNFFLSSIVRSFQYLDFFKENKLVSFLDIGLERTTLILFNNRKLDFLHSIPIGGNHITKDISQVMKLSFEESETLKKTFNKSELDFSYNEDNSNDNSALLQQIIGKNISIDLLKKVTLARIEEILDLTFKNLNNSKDSKNRKNFILVLIGNGSKLFNKNSFQLDDKYNFKEINYYEESDIEICKAGLAFAKIFKDEDLQIAKKNQKKLGIFQKFFNFFGSS